MILFEKVKSVAKLKLRITFVVIQNHAPIQIPLGGVVPGLGVQTDPLNPLKPMALGRGLAREQESPTAACSFPQTSSPTLQGISMALMGGMMADGLTAQGVRSQVISIISSLPLVFLSSFLPKYKQFFLCGKNESPFVSGIHTRRSSQRCEP